MTLIRKSELAARLAVSKARVSQMVAAGLPVEPNGLLDLERALEWVASHVDRSGSGSWLGRKAAPPVPGTIPASAAPSVATGPPPPPADTEPVRPAADPARALLMARAKKLLLEVRRAERIEKVEAGDLLDAADVKRSTFDVYRQVREALQAIPARVASAIAAEVRRALEAGGVATDAVAGALSAAAVENLLAAEVGKALTDLADAVERNSAL